MQSADPAERAAAQRAVIDGGERSLPLLKAMLRTRDQNLLGAAIDTIHRMGPDAMPLLVAMLQDRRGDIRWAAIDVLVDLAPATAAIQPALCRALGDSDVMVARDAARAIGALGAAAADSTPALTAALRHDDPHVRLYSAEALASIGAPAAGAVTDLTRLLGDPHPGVRWAACEALSSIGPAAAPAVPGLMDALGDEYLYVRLCAATALGNIGPPAAPAIEPLRKLASDPTLEAESRWALARITGIEQPPPSAVPVASSVTPTRAPATSPSPMGNPPSDWDIDTGRNVVWSAELGGETFGRPVVADGVIYLGSDNSSGRNPAFTDSCGTLLAFRASDGEFLWQDLAPRVRRGTGEFLLPSTTSAPLVDGERLYYMTAECQLRCLDTRGFADSENDGPYQSEPMRDNHSADIVWELDLCARLGVFPHEASNSDVLQVGDRLIVCTSNGVNEGHTRVPSPRAPSIVAVDRQTGHVIWQAIGAGENILHGQWCSPVAISVGGQAQVLLGGGDGWLRAYDPGSGREIWRFDGNPADSHWLPRPGVFSRNGIVASPVYDHGRVFIAMGDDPSHGNGPSLLHAISTNGQGDVTESRSLWKSSAIGRVVGTPAMQDGLIYVGDLGGRVSCLDAATGELVWQHETRAPIWGCLLLAGGRIYAGNTAGVMTILSAGRQKQVIRRIELDSALYSRPALVGDQMVLATARRLYLIASRP